VGILNGIDTSVWNPKTDPMLPAKFDIKTLAKGKQANKALLCERFNLSPDKPLIAFIGRLVGEKGADLIGTAMEESFNEHPGQFNFLALGAGEKENEKELLELRDFYPEQCAVFIGYDEALAHTIYAGADFLLMPSRVEPCGLNQLYSLRYGTVPMVRNTGGLHDSVIDFGDEGGYGIRFNHASVEDICISVTRAIALYNNSKHLTDLRKLMMGLDFSWDRSAKEYITLYESLNPII
jgi:starch synthase